MKNSSPVDSELPPGSETLSRPSLNSREDLGDIERLVRSFNTALISTRAESQSTSPDRSSDELHGLVNSPAFREILEASQRLAHDQALSPQGAAEVLIRTFRKIDQIWSDYIFSEGIARIQEQTTLSSD